METTLKSSQLFNVFKCFDRNGKGHLDPSDLRYIFAELFGSNEGEDELSFALQHLISLGSTQDSNISNELHFPTFVEVVNSTLKATSLKSILKGTFDRLTKGNDEITIDLLLNLAKRAGIEVGDDARIRLAARLPNGKANFTEFVNSVANT